MGGGNNQGIMKGGCTEQGTIRGDIVNLIRHFPEITQLNCNVLFL